MVSPAYLCICIYCMLQLGFFVMAEIRRHKAQGEKNRYFLWMLLITILSFAADIISSFPPDAVWLFPFTAAGNYLEIILNTVLLPLFFSYVCEQVFKLEKRLKRTLHILLWVMAVLCAITVLSTAFTGLIFYFDQAKVYHRGLLFVLPMAILFAMMVVIETFIISQKKKIEPHYYKPLALFLISPLLGWGLQLLIYGLPFSLLGITFASLVLFTNIQNRNMEQDYLTDVFNRQTLDRFIQQKINAATEEKTFSAILLDIDNFKFINDHFGHIEGDKALINTANILREAMQFTDFIARYGGDEFCIILNKSDPEAAQSAIEQINRQLLECNQSKQKPYQLQFSTGYATYHPSMGKNPEPFLKLIDGKMYEQKKAKRME